jgi:shikimate kinase
VDDPAAVIDSILHERDPLYREIADLVVATEQKKPQLVADEIARTIRQLNS